MYFNRIIFLTIIFTCFTNNISASIKDNILNKFRNIENISFNFEQNINCKVENGNCIIQYPKKIYCKYQKTNKILVSNGKSLVIKTLSSYYLYPLEKTPLNLILNKTFLIKKNKKFKRKKCR